ncbi:hypothetical protein HPB52_015285 [Rhipicephalus sanguineus]|uniref:Peptidase M13 N-terminal domain-containing protein n=1 Tax=Rhipicephalus sanguineus TaxID=34632 RepID=A0A9D4PRS0_RHISA|nr:hypothetical protein HPB52_015285 [Rhipicephalus sanguineus]
MTTIVSDTGIRVVPSMPTFGVASTSDLPTESFRPADEPGPKQLPPALSIFLAIFTPLVLGLVIWYVSGALLVSSGRHKATSFCCVDGARHLTQSINSSIDPCVNFTGYVCYNASRNRSTVMDLHQRLLEDILAAMPNAVTTWTSPAANTLSGFYKSCLVMPWSKEGILRNLTSIVIEKGRIQAAMTAREILDFFLKMSLQYRLPAAINIKKKFTFNALNNASTHIDISQARYAISELCTRCNDCIALVLQQFNRKIGCNVSEVGLLRFGSELPINKNGTAATETDDFGQLADLFKSVSLVEWKNALSAAYVDLREIDRVDVEGKPQLRKFMSSLSNPSNQPTSIAFIVAYSVLSSFSHFVSDLSHEAGGSQEVFCNRSVHGLAHTWEQLRSDMSSNIGKSWEIHVIFEVVIKAISRTVTNSSLFAAADHLAAKAFLRSLTLLLPHEYAVADNHPPNMTLVYLRDHFNMLEYEQWLMRKKTKIHVFGSPALRVHQLTLSAGNKVLVPTSFYHDLTHHSESSVMHNLPWLGTNIAYFVWDLLVFQVSWTKATANNLMDMRQCLRKSHTRPGTVSRRSVSLVLALKSLLNSLDQTDLYVPRTLDARWRLSHGQFFFLRMVERSWCHRDHSALRTVQWVEMNSALDLTPEFSEAFHCHAATAQRGSCFA